MRPFEKATVRLLACLLSLALLFSLSACSAGPAAEVTVLWSGADTVSDSLLFDTLESALRSKNLSYTHQFAAADSTTQIEQANAAVKNGCDALAVDAVNPTCAQLLVDLAKEHDLPIVFFGTAVDASLLEDYARAAYVGTDTTSFGEVNGTLIKTAVQKKLSTYDRNGDGTLSFVALGEIGDTLQYVDGNLTRVMEGSSVDVRAQILSLYATYTDERGNTVELLLTENDAGAAEAVTALQENGYNNSKKNRIPLTTVITATSPTGNATRDLIRKGSIIGATAEDADLIGKTIATALRNILNETEINAGVKGTVTVNGRHFTVPYITLT